MSTGRVKPGDRFGKLIVDRSVRDSDKQYEEMWICLCDCGGKTLASTRDLLRGDHRTCGCSKSKVGRKFGRLLVLEAVGHTEQGRIQYRCKCDCGNEIITHNVGDCKTNCGCISSELRKISATIHGDSKTRLHRIWRLIINRCNNSKTKRFHNYGGRGISICDEWTLPKGQGYINFKEWSMNKGYEDHLTIDRIDNDGNYEPGNCRWTTTQIQARNTSYNVYIKDKIVTDWAKLYQVTTALIYKKRKLNWSEDQLYRFIISKPLRKKIK